jgi:hypothetical protein
MASLCNVKIVYHMSLSTRQPWLGMHAANVVSGISMIDEKAGIKEGGWFVKPAVLESACTLHTFSSKKCKGFKKKKLFLPAANLILIAGAILSSIGVWT